MLAVLTVNNPTDTAVANELSLRQAVAQANLDAAAGTSDTIAFDSSLGGQTIQLTQGSLELSGAGAGTITIDGSSPSMPITLEGAYDFAPLLVDAGVQAVVTNLNIENSGSNDNGAGISNAGTLTVSNVLFSGNRAQLDGGAIENTASLTLSNDTFLGNNANQSGGAVDNSGGTATIDDCAFTNSGAGMSGGAIYNQNGGTLTVSNCTFTDNYAAGLGQAGGAIDNVSSTLTVAGSLFTGNTGAIGGGIENDLGSLTVGDTTFAGNFANASSGGGGGGAIDNSGTATVTDSTLSGNYADAVGGGIANTGTMTVSNSTIVGNNATINGAGNGGGGIENNGGALTLADDTISGNTAAGYQTTGSGGIQNDKGTVALQNTIVAGNLGDVPAIVDIGGVIITDNGYNLLGTAVNNSTADPTPGPGDVFSDAPLLSALGNYGGPTQTLAPLAGSPAVGAGQVVAGLSATDQRGLPRVVGGSLDIGAVETQAPTLAFATLGQTVLAGQPASITLQLQDLDGQPATAPAGGVTVSLASTSNGGALLDANGNPLGAGQLTIPAGASSATFEYSDTQQGSPMLSATAAGFASSSQQETILPAPISATPTTNIVVGRTLSSYFTGGIQNLQETITYTVYNESASPETGVLLTDTLAAGVTLVSASQQPDQSGQQLAWSLGTIQPFDRASVTITVSLSNSSILQLDAGAQAYATLDAAAISNSTPAATLTLGNVDPNLLASTPDANTTDPFVQEEAAALSYNAQNIFNFLHNDIGYNSYTGSLRGARGTLWSSAGNSLDVASLGIALMRASGIPAQYEEGTLSTGLTQQLILSMFPASYQTVGYIPAGTTVSDPADDSQLQTETQDHFWFQFNTGTGMQNADPLMAGATIGQAFAASTNTFVEVPAAMRQTTEIQLTAEIYSQADAEFGLGDGLNDTVVLDQTFNDVDLVGHPLTLGNFVNQTGIGATFSVVTNTYSPYLQLGDDAYPDPTQDPLIRGTDYQETLTNFPLGSQVLTGLFLDVTLSGAGTTAQTYDHTILDRIGYAAREGLASPNISIDPSGPPAVSSLDSVTISVDGAMRDPQNSFAPTPSQSALQQVASFTSAYAAASPDEQQALLNAGVSSLTTLLIEIERAQVANFESQAAFENTQLGNFLDVVGYLDSPRITVASWQVANGPGQTSALDFAVDLLRSEYRTEAAPGQRASATYSFNVDRGLAESQIESGLAISNSASPAVSAAAIFNQAAAQGIALVSLTSANSAAIDALPFSADVKARLASALASEETIVIPSQYVSISGVQTIGWYEIDDTTGETVGVLADGTHGVYDWAVMNQLSTTNATNPVVRGFFGFVAGFASGAEVLVIRKIVAQVLINQLQGSLNWWVTYISTVKNYTNALTAQISALEKYLFRDPAFQAGFILGYAVAANVTADPPLPDGEITITPFSKRNGAVATVPVSAANASSGAAVGSLVVANISLSGQLSATWVGAGDSSLEASSLSASNATVEDSNGVVIGSGAIALAAPSAIPAVVSGNPQFNVSGTGSLSLYGPAEDNLGVSGDWTNYTATVTGGASITVSTDGLMLNGLLLPAGTYTVTTDAATLSGSGQTTSPNFSGSASISATGGTVTLGPGTGSITSGGSPLDPTRGATLDGYTGTIDISANGDGTNAVSIDGSAANVLQVMPDPPNLSTDANTPITFQAVIKTSLSDTYNLTVNVPVGWTATINNDATVEVTPAPGVQAGTYSIQVIAQSQTDPNLVANALVNATITPTMPGMTLAVNPDTLFTVPYNGAQLPTAYRAVIHNTGPTADTYNLTFPTVPAGFTVLDSGTSVTIPAGATGFVGVYLQPSGTLPAPGTLESFSVTATSTSNAAITNTVTDTFAMPTIAAVTVADNPTALSSSLGVPVTTVLTITNVGNVPYDAAISPALPSGWTISGADTPVSLAIGASTTETVTITPAANAPLNSTQNVTLTYGQAVAQNTVSVVGVTPNPSTVEADTQVDVSASVLAGVTQAEQGSVSYTVKNSQGTVVFTSTPVAITLSEVIGVTSVDLGTLDTTGFAAGAYTINVSVSDASNQPIAGATGQGQLFVGAPITASQSLSATTLTPGSGTVTNTLSIAAQGQLGQVATDSAARSVVTSGNLEYVIGAQDITIVDVSNPASPTVVGTFGLGTLNASGYNVGALAGNELVVASGNTNGTFNFLVYSLVNPSSPTLLGNTTINYYQVGSIFVQGTTAYVTTDGTFASGAGPYTITDQFGDFLAIDFSNPASPTLSGALTNTLGTPEGGASNVNGGAAVSSSLAYVVGSTSTGGDTQTGTGQLQVVDISNPASLAVTNTLSIPGTVQALAVAVEGNRALVVGSSGGWQSPYDSTYQLTGNVTLTLLDITNPADPVILGSTQVTSATVFSISNGYINIAALGGNQFAINNVESNGLPAMLVVDASNPTSLGVTTFAGAGAASGMATSGGIFYASTGAGLDVYRTGSITNVPVTVTVQVPTTTGVSIVAGSFNIAPTQITTGATSETLVWNFPSLASIPSGGITWQTSVANLQAGEALPVTLGTTVQYTALGTAGSETLPPLVVAGVPETQTLTIPVLVAVPGAAAIASASTAAAQIGNTNLANQLNDLSIALTNLVVNPTSLVYLGQVQAAIASLITLITPDPFLAPYAPALATASAALGAATTAGQIDAAVDNLGTALDSLAQALADEAAHGFTIGLTDQFAEIQPGSPSVFGIAMQNTGTQTTTYDFSISGLPANVTATFSQPSITLASGATIPVGSPVTVSLSESGDTLAPLSFSVIATAEGAPEITQGTPGQLELRPEAVLVGAVTPTPPYTASGGTVDVSATLQSAVNEPRQFAVSYTVTDFHGNVLFTSPPVATTLGVNSTATVVDLGTVNTTGFANGTDTITVTAVDQSVHPLPTATGQGSLIVGLPVTAILSVSPMNAPTGKPTVTNSLQITSSIPLPDPLTLDGAVTTTAATTVALYTDATHNLAYVCGPSGIDIVNVSNPAAPVDDGTFGASEIVQGGLTVGRVDEIGGTQYLIVGSTTIGTLSSAPPFTLLIFSLAAPLSPSLVSTTTFNYGFLSDMVVEGNTVLVPVLSYSLFDGFFESQNGNVMSINVSNPAAPTLGSVLFGNSDSNAGTTQLGATIVNSQIAYVASSTANGASTTDGVGRVLVVNYSNPAAMTYSEVDIPGTYQVVDVAVQGNEALVVGRTGGTDAYGVNGFMTLSLLDITNPQIPTVMGTMLVTTSQFPVNAAGYKISAQPLGNGLFAVSEATVDGNSELMVVDTSDPNNIVASYTAVPALVNEMAVSGNLLYTTSAQGLTIYNIGTVESIPLTVSVEVPTTTGVAIVPNSYSTPPSQVITGATFDTLVWNETLAYGDPTNPFTWQSTITNLTTGQVVPVTLGATINFTSQGTPGTFQVPGTAVTGTSIISIVNPSQTVQPGATATYDVQFTNPTDSTVNYYPSVNGVGASINEPITVGPNATVDVPLEVFSNGNSPLGDTPFTVTAQSGNGSALGTASADRILAGAPIVEPNPNAYGIVGTLTPTQATLGQGDTTQFILQLTNTGSTDERFDPQVSGLPSGVFGNFNQSNIDVPPGASNFRDIPLTVNAESGLTPGVYPFTITITASDGTSTTTVDGTLTLSPLGVDVSLSPSSVAPGGSFDMYVYNKGTVSDTYNLSLGGPAASVSSLSMNSVTLSPGQGQDIPISVGAIDFADAGSLELTAIATSQTNSAVGAESNSTVTIPTTAGLSTSLTPSSVTLPSPGPSSFAMLVNNLGNIDDSYTATITGTTGGILASLIGLDGLPTQSIPLFDLPGLSTGELLLNTDLSTPGQGTVTVTVTDAAGLVSSSTATVTIPAIGSPTTTSTTVSSDHPTGSTYGQSVEFTATVAGGISGTPTGTVQFEIDSVDVGLPVTLSGGTASFSTSALTAIGHTITAVYTSDNISSFGDSQGQVGQNVSPAPLTVTANSPTKVYGATLPALTYTTSTFVNGDTAATALTGALSTTATASSPVAGYPISQGTLAAANYTITFVPGTLSVTPAPLTVTANSPSKVYGAVLPALTYTTSTFVNGDTAATALTGALSTTATASSPVAGYPISQGTLAAANYAITFIGGTLHVTPAPLTVTANSPSKVYGAVLPALTFTTSAFVNGDTAATALTGALSTTATASSPVAGYPISQGTLAAANYTITLIGGTLHVTPAPLTVSANSPSKVYGAALPALTFTTSTFVNGDTAATALTGALSTTATASSPVANYPISQGTLTAANYTITFVAGTLSVTAAPLTITADNKSKVVGSANPPLTFTPAGFVNGDTVNSLTTQPTLTTTATTASPVGGYPITASGAVDPNYSIAYVPGTLSVTAATTGTATKTTLTASCGNSPVYGQTITFTATVSTSAKAGTPGGVVTFMDGNSVLGTGTLHVVHGSDVITFSTSTLATGTHSITAVYAGGGGFAGSTSNALVEKVNKDSTCTTLVSSARSPGVGQSVTFTATITVTAPGGGIPTGSVTFKDGNTVLGPGTMAVVGGKLQATLTTNSLAIGNHSITAVYGGDTNYTTSTAAVSLAVCKSSTTTGLSSNANPATAGQPVTLTAKIAVVAPGSGTPTGTVTFRNGFSNLGTETVQVIGGIAQATLTTSSLSLGRHSITAVYGGSSGYIGSTSAVLLETVNVGSAVSPAAVNPLDVNGDGVVTPLDALMIINELNSANHGTAATPAVLAACDVNQDGQVTPLDALMVINYLNDAVAAVTQSSSNAAAAAVSGQLSTVSTEAIAFALSTAASGGASSEHKQTVDAVFGSYPDSID